MSANKILSQGRVRGPLDALAQALPPTHPKETQNRVPKWVCIYRPRSVIQSLSNQIPVPSPHPNLFIGPSIRVLEIV